MLPPISNETFAELDYRPRTRLVFGNGRAAQAGVLARECGGTRVLLVTDGGIVAAGHAGRIESALRNAGLVVEVFQDVHENPTTRDVANCVAAARRRQADLLVGLGGGSAMDTAKGCNFILTNGGEMKDYWGVGKASRPMLPLVAIPTTAGTGSECQCAALIADEATHRKMACLDPKAAARVAILDPELTLSQPPRVTACTGLDAIAHAVETAVTNKRNPISQVFSREAFRLCAGAFAVVLAKPDHLLARGQMLLGASFAGMAIENSMLGAAHAAANPLTAVYGITHGEAVGLMLPHVVRFNQAEERAARIYAELALGIGWHDPLELPALLTGLVERAGLPTRLRDCGVKEEALPRLAEQASKQWTGTFNPRPVGPEDFARLYAEAF